MVSFNSVLSPNMIFLIWTNYFSMILLAKINQACSGFFYNINIPIVFFFLTINPLSMFLVFS
jgi:hypothetical protein